MYNTSTLFFLLAVVVVAMSPSGSAYMGRQVPRRGEELRLIHVVPKYIFCVDNVSKVTLMFCCPFLV